MKHCSIRNLIPALFIVLLLTACGDGKSVSENSYDTWYVESGVDMVRTLKTMPSGEIGYLERGEAVPIYIDDDEDEGGTTGGSLVAHTIEYEPAPTPTPIIGEDGEIIAQNDPEEAEEEEEGEESEEAEEAEEQEEEEPTPTKEEEQQEHEETEEKPIPTEIPEATPTPEPAQEEEQQPTPVIQQANSRIVPEVMPAIPASYWNPCSQPGTIEDFYYTSYDSLHFDDKSRELTKHALVYLPYRYNEEMEYDIMYLMHGLGNNEGWIFKSSSNPSDFKNVIDNAIANGEIRPCIIVCSTTDNFSCDRTRSYGGQQSTLCRNYHNELVNCLLPAVETHYSTYSTGGSAYELMASRDHRGFGGFSNGGLTTWSSFLYCVDYFHWWLPMSAGTNPNTSQTGAVVAGRDAHSFYVFMATGTADGNYSVESKRAKDMAASPYFIENSAADIGNFSFRAMAGKAHRDRSAMEYIYNGLRFFYP